jgi:hypothetical protein
MEAPVPVLRFVCDSHSVCSVSVRSVVPCVARRSGVRRVARGRGGPLPPEPDPDYFTPTILTIALIYLEFTIDYRSSKRVDPRLRSAALIRPRSPRVPTHPTPRTRAIY